MEIKNLINKGCRINDYGELDITTPYDKEKLGINSWGYIDFLVRNNIYPVVRFVRKGKHEHAVYYKPRFDKKKEAK
jgi:hypothetical protein